MNGLTSAISDDIPLALDYGGYTYALGDLYTGTLDGKPGFAWTASGWGFDSGSPCHALQADLEQTGPTEWSDRERDIRIRSLSPREPADRGYYEAITNWHRLGAKGDRARRRADAIWVIKDYNPTFEPDPEP